MAVALKPSEKKAAKRNRADKKPKGSDKDSIGTGKGPVADAKVGAR